MSNHLLATAVLTTAWTASLMWPASGATAADWITARSIYSHDPSSGARLTQYTPIGPFYIYPRPDYQRSGFRHTRSSLRVGGSADHRHIVERWGQPVRPYGEWQFPYRPYSAPYDHWGPPYGGLGPNYYFGAPHGPARPHPGGPVGPGRHHPRQPSHAPVTR